MAIDPYIKKDPNDLIRSGDWNDIQVRARQEIRSHTHKGDADGTPIPREGIQPNAIDGTRIDPSSRVTVAQLKVVDRDLLVDINTLITRANDFDARINALTGRTTALEATRVNRAGDTITGALAISGGNLTVTNGAIIPRVGNSAAAGIQFPANPGGGSGDEAFIRYYVETGEVTKLLIGVGNDVDDSLGLWQAGAERLTVRNGIVEVNTSLAIGTAQVNPPAKLSLGTETANTKIALHDNPGDLYGLGIGGAQLRLHVGNPGARFSFLNAANGTEVFTIKGNGFVGLNDPTPNEMLSLAGLGSCIELGANVADKEANAGKIAYRKWSDALEIVGGGSGGQRRLKIWAEAGTEFSGAIVPRVGNADTAGIQFPKDPGGGAGDEAFLRYYVVGGETTKLLLGINNDADDTLGLWQAGAERLTLYNGNVGIGTPTPQVPLHVRQRGASGIRLEEHGGTGRFLNIFYEGQGTVVFYHQNGQGQYMTQDGIWYRNSDLTLKEDVTRLDGMLDKIMALRPVRFQWKATGTEDIGFVAQDVEKIFPQIVSSVRVTQAGGKELKGLPYDSFGVLAISALQELKGQYDQRLEALERMLQALAARGA